MHSVLASLRDVSDRSKTINEMIVNQSIHTAQRSCNDFPRQSFG
jgi:hypothetical protein